MTLRNAVERKVCLTVKRRTFATPLDSAAFDRCSRDTERVRLPNAERRDRYMRGLKDPESETNVYLRSVVQENERQSLLWLLTEVCWGEHTEAQTRTVQVPWQESITMDVPWEHTYARYEPASWFDKLILDYMAYIPTLLLMCFPPVCVWAQTQFGGHVGQTELRAGHAPFTYTHTTQTLRDPFVEDRFGKMDRDFFEFRVSSPAHLWETP